MGGQQTARRIGRAVTHAGFESELVQCGDDLYASVEKHIFDVVILDPHLADLDRDTCRRVSNRGTGPLVLWLCDGESPHSRLVGLKLGADDSVARAISGPVMIARLVALCNRSRNRRRSGAVTHEFRLDRRAFVAARSEAIVTLRRKEFQVLEHLILADGDLVSFEALSRAVWGTRYARCRRSLRVTVDSLRVKLGEPRAITREPGIGYRLVSAPPPLEAE